MDEYITINALIRMLERRALSVGGDSYIALDGFVPCKIMLVDNHDPELYVGPKTLISG